MQIGGKTVDLLFSGCNLRKAWFSDIDSDESQTRLRSADTAEAGNGTNHRDQTEVYLARAGDIAGHERGVKVAETTRNKMADDADEAGGAHSEPRQIQRVVAGEELELGGADQLCAGVEVALGVLDGLIRGCSASRRIVSVSMGTTERGRNVVQHDGQVGRVGDGGEVCKQSGLGGRT